jgi:hypothetical protein
MGIDLIVLFGVLEERPINRPIIPSVRVECGRLEIASRSV